MMIVAKRHDSDCFRLLEDGVIVGFALRLTNGKWVMTDTKDRHMDSIHYESPNEVAKCFSTVRLLVTK
jgi:hypothetical protein